MRFLHAVGEAGLQIVHDFADGMVAARGRCDDVLHMQRVILGYLVMEGKGSMPGVGAFPEMASDGPKAFLY